MASYTKTKWKYAVFFLLFHGVLSYHHLVQVSSPRLCLQILPMYEFRDCSQYMECKKMYLRYSTNVRNLLLLLVRDIDSFCIVTSFEKTHTHLFTKHIVTSNLKKTNFVWTLLYCLCFVENCIFRRFVCFEHFNFTRNITQNLCLIVLVSSSSFVFLVSVLLSGTFLGKGMHQWHLLHNLNHSLQKWSVLLPCCPQICSFPL